MARKIKQFMAILWASPWSLLGLCVGGLALATGGRVAYSGGVLEFTGGILSWLLARVPIKNGAAAMTLGHVVIASSAAELDNCRDHERIHVRQYERWGPFFVPAYFLAGAYLACCGKNPYRENPFEVEAYDKCPVRESTTQKLAILAVAAGMTLAPLPGRAESLRDPYEDARRRLVREILEPGGISNRDVLRAIENTPRHLFVPSTQRKKAYLDMALPIGQQQTISSPFIVAFMTEVLAPKSSDTVLEIGTGSGYQAAVLSPLVKEVYSIEIVPELAKSAEKVLKKIGYRNVHTRAGDGYLGWPAHAPFDKIIVTCSPEKVPQPLQDQLAEGGRMVIPVGERYQQTLYLFTKVNGELKPESLRPTLFVPMTGEAQAEREVQPDGARPKIVNGSFEGEVNQHGHISGWYYQRQVERIEDPLSPDKEHFLRFANETEGLSSHILQGLAVDGVQVKQVQIKGSIRTQDVVPGPRPDMRPYIVISFYDAQRHELQQAHLGPWLETDGWQRVSKVVPVPRAATEAILRIGLFGATGTMDVDQVTVARHP